MPAPGLEGLDPRRLVEALLSSPARIVCVTDAYAAAHAWWSRHRATGRLLAISLGTGVGAAVLDDGEPLHVSGESPGHLGQIDVGPCGGQGDGGCESAIGPDGVQITLEAFVGGAALQRRFGAEPLAALAGLPMDDGFFVALARAIRVAHAIYRPDEVALLGGVGAALAPRIEALDGLVRTGLTAIAKPHARLRAGDSPFLAATGAARLASATP